RRAGAGLAVKPPGKVPLVAAWPGQCCWPGHLFSESGTGGTSTASRGPRTQESPVNASRPVALACKRSGALPRPIGGAPLAWQPVRGETHVTEWESSPRWHIRYHG